MTASLAAGAGWHARLALHYRHIDGTTVGRDTHEGPLRVLRALYPEGAAVCHHVLVHPPGGVVGGDTLQLEVTLEPGAHALITTPGAARFYRSDGALALQHARLRVAAGARLEWLPLEAIAHPGCRAENRVCAELAPGGEMIGWDVVALGLPAAGQPFDRGAFTQQLELPGVWLDRGRIDGGDSVLRGSPVGLAGHSVLGTAWFACGGPVAPARRDALLDAARAVVQADALAATAGVTQPQPPVIVARVLGHGVEPVLQLLARVRAAWRLQGWGLQPEPPRIWST